MVLPIIRILYNLAPMKHPCRKGRRTTPPDPVVEPDLDSSLISDNHEDEEFFIQP